MKINNSPKSRKTTEKADSRAAPAGLKTALVIDASTIHANGLISTMPAPALVVGVSVWPRVVLTGRGPAPSSAGRRMGA